MHARGLLIAAPQSGAGKTTVTLALLAALAKRGVRVRAAKAGPDYIDPAFHAAATGSQSDNLDTWAMPSAVLDSLMARAASAAELLVIEGAMGLFDGAPIPRHGGATADLAARFGLPVILVLDVVAQAQSAAAVARGFATHDPAVRVAGVILNRVAGERHRMLAADAIGACGIQVLGALPRDEQIVLPERHLGLVQAAEQTDLNARLAALADLAERHLDIEAILGVATPLPALPPSDAQALPPPGQRIALAFDAAFTFVYPHVLEGWRRAGAEIVHFSPLADEPPPDDCDACWLPGGYPELHAGRLAAAQRFRTGLSRFAQTRPVHGECGGYMVLGRRLEDANGVTHAMLGLLGHATSFAKRKMQLGYREARLLAPSMLGKAGDILRGHEFHYATLVAAGGDAPFADLSDAQNRTLGPAGGQCGHVTGTFFHVIARL
ncbi:MAG: cobyrinate a,c-diamide synthase [Methylovirgula sp.]